MTELAQLIRDASPAAWRPVAAIAAWRAVVAADLEGDFVGTVAARLRDGEDPDETHVLVVEALADELAGLAYEHPQDAFAARRAAAAATVVAAAQPHPGRAALDATRRAMTALDGPDQAALEADVRDVIGRCGPAVAGLPELSPEQAYAAARAFALAHGATLPGEPDATQAWLRAAGNSRDVGPGAGGD